MTPVKGTGRKPGIEALVMGLKASVYCPAAGPYCSGVLVSTIVPLKHQLALPLDRIIRTDPPGSEAIEMDVLIVGAGPAGLACAIELSRLAKRARETGGARSPVP